MRYWIADVETTGLNSDADQIIELSIFEVTETAELIREFYVLCNPTVGVHPEAAAKNGWPQRWEGCTTSQGAAREMLNAWADEGPLKATFQLINWNPQFDYNFLKKWAKDFELVRHTLDIYSMLFPYALEYPVPNEVRGYPTLEETFNNFIPEGSVRKPEFHTAYGDVRAVFELFKEAIGRSAGR